MIGGALRLAGMALSNPVGRGIAGTALASGAIAGAPAAIDLASGGMTQDRLRELAGTQRDDGTYDIRFTDKILGGLDKALGGKGISEATVQEKADQIEQRAIKKDVTPLLQMEGLEYTPGMTRGQAGQQIREAKQQREFDAQVNNPIYQDTQRRLEQTRLDQLQESRLARQDSIDARRDRLDFDRANLAFKQAESQRQFNLQSKRAHKEKMAALIAGLASLGGAFAI